MGFSFNFFGDSEHRVFNYKPRYYDPEKEERRRMFGAVDGGAAGSQAKDGEKKEEERKPGDRIRGSFREGNYQRTRPAAGGKVQKIIGLVGLLLFFVVLYYIAKFYGMIL